MLQIWAYFDKSRLHLLIHNALLIDMIPPNTSNSTGFTKSALVGSTGPLISFAQLFGSEARHRTSSTKPFHATRLRLEKNESKITEMFLCCALPALGLGFTPKTLERLRC